MTAVHSFLRYSLYTTGMSHLKIASKNLLATQLAPSVGRPEVVEWRYGLELKRSWCVSITEVTLISAISVIYVQVL